MSEEVEEGGKGRGYTLTATGHEESKKQTNKRTNTTKYDFPKVRDWRISATLSL